MHENTKCSQLICSGEYRKLNLRHRLIGYKKDIKNSEMGFWCLFCVLEIFSKNEERRADHAKDKTGCVPDTVYEKFDRK